MSQWPYQIPPQFKWIKEIEKGDVIRSKSGRLRVVRYVNHSGPSLPKTSVAMTIAHCSWTHRPYTIVNGNDLRQMGYEPVAANFKLKTKFDRQLERDFQARTSGDCCLSCCDVKGIA